MNLLTIREAADQLGLAPKTVRKCQNHPTALFSDIQQALTYYDDPLNLLKKCDYVTVVAR